MGRVPRARGPRERDVGHGRRAGCPRDRSRGARRSERRASQAFTAAVAHETVAASLRRLMRLDEALEHAEQAVSTLRELGARWELASALGDRGAIHRLAGRLEEGERDLREAFILCRDLQERALVTWTAAELAKVQALRGDTGGGAAGAERPRRPHRRGRARLRHRPADRRGDRGPGRGRPGDRAREVAGLDRGRTRAARRPERPRRPDVVDGSAVRRRAGGRGRRARRGPTSVWNATDGGRR